jgi:RNA polymerase sigma factor (sigma-70 family)
MCLERLTDAEIMARVQKGEKELFRIIVERHKTELFKLLWNRLHNEEDVWDVLQMVWHRASQKASSYDLSYPSAFPWLATIAVRYSINSHRVRSRRPEVSPGEKGLDTYADKKSPDPQAEVFKRLDFDLLLKALEALPPDQRGIVILHFFQDLTFEEIAKCLAITPAKTFRLWQKALKSLKRDLSDETE